MIDVRQFTREVTEAFVARYPERFNGSEDSVFTEDLARNDGDGCRSCY